MLSIEEFLINLIHQQGPLKISEFMGIALLHPQYGYYHKKNLIGRRGDFITAPEISQLFGEIIAFWLINQLEVYYPFITSITLIELGPGKGTMMLDILRIFAKFPHLYNKLNIILIEQSPTLLALQKNNLNEHIEKIIWQSDLSNLPQTCTFFLANEFFDALPINQYIKTLEGWKERKLGLSKKGNLTFILTPIGDLNQEECPLNGFIEISPTSKQIANLIKNHLQKNSGGGLIIDYGYFIKPYRDTLQSVRNHTFNYLLDHIGEADITAYVDFSHLFEGYAHSTQRDFLLNNGILVRANQLISTSPKHDSQIKLAVNRLVYSMGELFKVVFLTLILTSYVTL